MDSSSFSCQREEILQFLLLLRSGKGPPEEGRRLSREWAVGEELYISNSESVFGVPFLSLFGLCLPCAIIKDSVSSLCLLKLSLPALQAPLLVSGKGLEWWWSPRGSCSIFLLHFC